MTPADVVSRFPQFAETDITVIQTQIDDAELFVNRCKWGNFYELGLANLVAHNLTLMSTVDDGSGSLTARVSKSIGDVSVSYSAGMVEKFANDPFQRTMYGQMYRRLAKMVGIGAVAV